MKDRIYAFAASALIIAVLFPVCAKALPGQSKSAECAWAKQSRSLSNVQCESGSEGDVAYISAKISKPSWSDRLFFESHPDQSGKIAFEKIGYAHAPNVGGVDFRQSGGNGLRLVKSFYAAIAADFSSAAHLADIRKYHIYRGHRLVYVVVSVRYVDTTLSKPQQTTIENDFMIFPRSSLTAAQNYARRHSAGI